MINSILNLLMFMASGLAAATPPIMNVGRKTGDLMDSFWPQGQVRPAMSTGNSPHRPIGRLYPVYAAGNLDPGRL